jgi:hypothetical protein
MFSSPFFSYTSPIGSGSTLGGQVIFVREVALFLQKPNHALGESGHHDCDFLISRRIDPPVLRALMGFVVATFEEEHMVMDVQIETSAESLNESDGTGLESGTKSFPFGFFPDVSRDGPVDDSEAAGLDLRIFGQDESHGHGERKHPLSNSDFGKYFVHQVRGALGHSPAAAGRAESALLTRKCDEFFELTVLTLKSQEPMGQNPAFEKGLELLSDVLGQELSICICECFEGSIVSSDGLIEDRLFWSSRLIGSREFLKAEL